MNKEISKRTYSQNDINKAFELGYTTAVIQIEESIVILYNMQRSILQSLKTRIPEEEVSLVREKHNKNKIINFQSYMKK